jgi:hypothetical protein
MLLLLPRRLRPEIEKFFVYKIDQWGVRKKKDGGMKRQLTQTRVQRLFALTNTMSSLAEQQTPFVSP